MPSPIKVYWDSCAWIGLLNGEPGRKVDLELIYGQARQGLVELWTFTLAIVEVNRLADEVGRAKPIPPESLAKIDALLFQPFVKLIAVDVDIARRSRTLVRETVGLKKKPDAIHLASAIRWNVHLLHTYDNDDLLHLNGQFNCADGEKLVISVPSDPHSTGGLFAKQTG